MSGPALEPWTRPVDPAEVLHLGEHGSLGHAPFRLSVGGARHVLALPSDARALRREGMRLPEALVVLEAAPSVIRIRADTLEFVDLWVRGTRTTWSRGGWTVLCERTEALLVSEDGDVRWHEHGVGLAEPMGFDGTALSYTCDLFSERHEVPLADMDRVPWRPLLRGDRAA